VGGELGALLSSDPSSSGGHTVSDSTQRRWRRSHLSQRSAGRCDKGGTYDVPHWVGAMIVVVVSGRKTSNCWYKACEGGERCGSWIILWVGVAVWVKGCGSVEISERRHRQRLGTEVITFSLAA
jgi:hypothetical protein